MRRHAIGIISIVLLAASAGLWLWWFQHPREDLAYAALGATFRVGLLMGALWLAYPEVRRLPQWIWVTIPILLATLAVKPKWFLIALPIVIALAILRPRWPRGG